MRQANGGGTVFLRGGQYVESIDLTKISGTEGLPLLVRPCNVERVTIDATVLQFRGPVPNTDWKPVPAHDGEFVSTAQFDPTPTGSTVVSAGAFLDRKDPQTGRPGTPDWSATASWQTSAPPTSCGRALMIWTRTN